MLNKYLTQIPQIEIDQRLNNPNIFNEVFGHLSIDEWEKVMLRSLNESIIEGVYFPSFPPKELQSLVHGHFGEESIIEAFKLYRFLHSQGIVDPSTIYYMKGYFLDFGSGWGRILRPFIRDFPLKNIFAYEPDTRFCVIARSHNPYVNFINGNYMPDGTLPRRLFDLIVSFSVFSHLSFFCAESWIRELSEITSINGRIVFTTWGLRFLERLKREKEMLNKGQEIHWYSKICIEKIGDLDRAIDDYLKGKFLWYPGKSDIYGEAFLSESVLKFIISRNRLPLELELFDNKSLPQDLFILWKTRN